MDLEILTRFSQAYQYRLNAGTIKIYECAIKQFFQETGKALESVRKRDIVNWLNQLANERGFKPSTLNNKISALKVFYRYCYEEGLLDKNPLEKLKHVVEEERKPHYLTNEQLAKLRKFLAGQIQERAVLEILYATGIRISELVAMKKEDIDWSERIILIPDGKGNKGRIVLFTSECSVYLKAYLDSRTDTSPFVFDIQNANGTNSNSVNLVEEWFRYYSIRLEFKVSPHTLRHTFAAHLAAKGMPLECIQQLMGHEDYRATRIYAKLYDQVRKQKYDEFM